MNLGGFIATASSLPARRIIPAQERSAINIAHSEILASGGTLKLVDDAMDRSLVQISQGLGQLQLRIGGVIGRLPLTETLALDISPKFPISNLARLLDMSDQSLDRRVSADRLYDFSAWNGCLPELLLRSFALQLKLARSEGIHRVYQRQSRADIPRPKLDFRRSEQQFWARGIPTKAIIETFDFAKDNEVNRMLKAALLYAIPLATKEPSLAAEVQQFAELLRSSANVGRVAIDRIDDECKAAIQQLPRFKMGHAKAVLIARELIKRASPDLEFADRRMALPSFLINLDKVFESYVRNTLRSAALRSNSPLRVEDGNSASFSKALLNDNPKFRIMPDILILEGQGASPKLIGDVKYKTKPTEEDRYQVIAHALSYRTRRAVLIYPARTGGPRGSVRLGEVGPAEFPIQLYEYHFDLGNDLETEELAMAASVLT